MAVQMLRKTTMKRVETRNHCCQPSLSILVMINTPTNRVAITERAAKSLQKKFGKTSNEDVVHEKLNTYLRLRLNR